MLGTTAQEPVDLERRFRALYRDNYRQVYVYFRRRTDVEHAKDGTADTFLTAWRRIDDVPVGDRALPWLYGTARRVLANQWRSRRRSDRLHEKVGLLGVPEEPGPEVRAVRAEEAQAVLDALGRLRSTDREVIRLAEWEGLSHGDIATVLGCSAHAVDQRMLRARRRLAVELGLDFHASAVTRPAEGGTS